MIRPIVDPALIVIGASVLLALIVLGLSSSPRARRSGWVLRLVMLLLLVAIALRPGWGTAPTADRPSDLEVLVFVDRTTSMSALDWDGERPRLDGVREDVRALMQALPSARFTVVTFGREVRAEIPSTSDVVLVDETLDLLPREEVFAGKGSLIDRPLDRMQTMLGELQDARPERRRVVILMSDGENTASEQQRSFAPLEGLVDAGAVLGYGTQPGGLMPLDEKRPEAGWVADPATDEPARSRIDEANLRKVARELGVPYLHRTSEGGLTDLASGWQKFSDSPADGGEVQAAFELTWLLALALLVVALIDLRHHWRRFWQARRELA
jgi:Ca-activated chloride channel homolog